MKKLLLMAVVLGIAPWTQAAVPTFENGRVAVSIDNRLDALWSLTLRGTGVVQAVAPRPSRSTGAVGVTFDGAGRAVIEAEFDHPGARIVFFGVE